MGRTLGAICLALAASIWGSMYVVSKYVLEFVPPFTLLWLRYAIAGLLLAIIMIAANQYKVAKKDLLLLVWIGFIGYFVSVDAVSGHQIIRCSYRGIDYRKLTSIYFLIRASAAQ